jgi:hypothetical protein
MPRFKFGVTGKESSPKSPTISYRHRYAISKKKFCAYIQTLRLISHQTMEYMKAKNHLKNRVAELETTVFNKSDVSKKTKNNRPDSHKV